MGKNKTRAIVATRVAVQAAESNPVVAGVVLATSALMVLMMVLTLITIIVAEKSVQATSCNNDVATGVAQIGTDPNLHLTAQQKRVASKIWAVIRSRAAQGSFPQSMLERVTIITFEASSTESGITNPRGGDRDSGGTFQMRPSAGWGTRAQVTNVTYATNKFISVMLTVPDWQTKPYGDVAQAVERSDYPDRYATHAVEAETIYKQFSGSGSDVQTVASVDASGNCADADPTHSVTNAAVQAALNAVGTDSKPGDGADVVSGFYHQAGLTLPTSVGALANYPGQPSLGLSTTWIPASDIKSGANPLQPGDILFWSDSSPPTRSNVSKAGLYVGSGATGDAMHIATYNVRGSTHTPASGPQSGPARIQRAAALITGQHFAVVGLQELQANQRAQLLRSLGGRYGIYPSRPQYGLHQKGINSVNSIIWDKSQVSFVGGSSLPMPYYFNRRSMHIPLVTLQDAKSGQQFYVANTHDPAGAYAHLRYLDAERHAMDANNLTASGSPMFFTGDFNSAYSEHAKVNQVWQHQRQYMTWCVMTRSQRMLDGYDASRNPVRTGECPQQTTREKGGPVDHVYVSSNIHVAGYHYIADRSVTASDHGVVYIDASLSGAPLKHHAKAGKLGEYVGLSKKGKVTLQSVSPGHLAGALRLKLSAITTTAFETSGGPWQSPLRVSAPITCTYGYGTCHGSEAHDGDDLGVPVGTPVYAAHSGHVYSAGYGSASGNQIIIDNDGAMGSGYGTKYEHMSRFASGIQRGAAVSVGQLIGYSGDTGNVTGPHLHFSVCTNTAQCVYGSGVGTSATTDPIPFMLAHGVKL